ncbi:hypothetical protein DVH24_006287 [Malus domestica]|uniref:Uncharacterized protein n=1 Tax=Malus domestica TaxID=3750 RepID=A0A498K9P9_MALDO|nr:hypothetical protein DVH24_006287 [Malus domestica]
MKILRKRRWEELKTLWLLVYLHQGHRAWFLAYKCINGCFRIYLIYLCCTCFNLCLFPCIFVPIDSVTRALQFARMMSLHAAPKAEWACLLTKLSRGAHQRFACWGNMEITSHDLSLHHPNFAFVNCERQTKYEEIIGDYVKPAMQEQDLITINLHPCDNAYVKVHSIPIWLDSWVLCKISCFRKTASGQRQSDRERGKGKSGDLTAMDYVASQSQFYAFKWITLLLTQEFNFADSLHTWDTLSSDLRVLSWKSFPQELMKVISTTIDEVPPQRAGLFSSLY